jgi:hypothetical protein
MIDFNQDFLNEVSEILNSSDKKRRVMLLEVLNCDNVKLDLLLRFAGYDIEKFKE